MDRWKLGVMKGLSLSSLALDAGFPAGMTI